MLRIRLPGIREAASGRSDRFGGREGGHQMAKLRRVPDHAIKITTYDEFRRFVLAFADSCFNLLIVIGGAGLGKTRVVRDAVGPDACWISGNGTAFGTY